MINNVRERNPMPEQAREVRCTNFNEVALGYTEADAIREAMRCLELPQKALRGRLPHSPADPRVHCPRGRGGL